MLVYEVACRFRWPLDQVRALDYHELKRLAWYDGERQAELAKRRGR